MISVGIDVSKGKSTVCILEDTGAFISKPYSVLHNRENLLDLAERISVLRGEVRVVMEFTGGYHAPILKVLQEHGIFVAVVSPLLMHKYANAKIRPGKTDVQDAVSIATFGISNWHKLIEFTPADPRYSELKILSRHYNQYISMRIKAKLTLSNLLDQSMPGIMDILENSSVDPSKDKLNAFVCKYWHYDNIRNFTEKQFVHNYILWARKAGYEASQVKAYEIYSLAQSSITTIASNIPSTKMLILEAIRVHREVNATLDLILTQMQQISKELKEYEILRSMKGIGDKLAPRFIAEVGDVRRFYSAKCLVAYAGIDTPDWQSGRFTSQNKRISKRGSKHLRKVGYEMMASLKRQKPCGDPVYLFMLKKENEGKPKKVAKIAGLNKFLHIYYARVSEAYR